MNPELSIIVCTRDRSRALGRCLAAVAALDVTTPLEAIVVDNGSTDDTEAVATSFGERVDWMRTVGESNVGLSRARNRGAAEASSPLLAYLDDDATPERGWARALVRCFAETDAAIVGGPILPRFEETPPAVVSACHLGAWSCQDHGETRREIREFPYLFGANFAVRRDHLRRLGGFDETLGRRGSSLLSGEDTDLCERTLAAGGRILYEPQAIVHHWIAAERLSSVFLRRRALATGHTRAIRMARDQAASSIAATLTAKATKLPAHALLWGIYALLGRYEVAAERAWSVFATLGMLRYFATRSSETR